ncbi:DUF58 domain-containing protein [Halomarina litorea]|uniref:DUF58 domain-containing protein n=1 Tax=Halomarina litorea TaxID=2961595 RepID=UPI0020C335C1|nr:DUF58 domain-containing protein [Halomarina sp. BCD28]
MMLTPRGIVVALAAVGAFAVGTMFGQPGLNAVAAPALIGLLVGFVQVWRADRPTVERIAPTAGFPGDVRTMRLDVTASGPVTVRDRLGDGLRPTAHVASLGGGGRVEYDLEFARRGVHEVGPTTVTLRDALGLFTHDYVYRNTDDVLVYPSVQPVTAGGVFAGLVERAGSPERTAFDSLREYVPGDALRDIHWKSSAKRDDIVVVEFAAEDEGAVSVVAEATPGPDGTNADAMATAAASVVAHLLDAGVEVSLVAPGGRLDPGIGERQRRAAFELLARTPPGRVDSETLEGADVRIVADGETTVSVGGQRVPFDHVADGSVRLGREVPA